MILLASYTFVSFYLHHIGRRTIEAQWHDIVSGDSLRETLTDALALARQHRATNWIADDRRLGPMSADDLAWVAAHMLPALADLGFERLAMVEAENSFNNVLISDAYTPALQKLPFEVRRFHDIRAARAWACGLPSVAMQ